VSTNWNVVLNPAAYLISDNLASSPYDLVESLTSSEETATNYGVEYGYAIGPSMLAGQLCYMSFGEKRSKDHRAYIKKILEQKHGSVLEHTVATVGLTGIDRAITHELVRHRAGFAYSQVSQRYVDSLRFVFPVELNLKDDLLEWGKYISACVAEYDRRLGLMSEGEGTRGRKERRQAARRCLPNETEAPIIVTGNMRSWRHFLEVRGSEHADLAMRNCAIEVLNCLKPSFDDFLQDIRVEAGVIKVEYSKV
jgi:thymidylate synthase (FAD)